MGKNVKGIDVIGVPMDLGAGRRGVDMGPSALRTARLGAHLTDLGHDVRDCGDVPVHVVETQEMGSKNCRYLESIAEACGKLSDRVAETLDEERFPLVIGGDHSINIGTMSGFARHFGARDEKVGLIWIDAHADMNTPETSISGNVHGMPLAVGIGLGTPELTELGCPSPHLEPGSVALLGIRDVDVPERKTVRSSGVHAYTMRDLDERGVAEVLREALRRVRKDTVGYVVTLDADGLDPHVAPGVGTPVKGGISYREAHLMMEIIAETPGLLGFEVTEVNPLLDQYNQTAHIMVELVQSALGKTIL